MPEQLSFFTPPIIAGLLAKVVLAPFTSMKARISNSVRSASLPCTRPGTRRRTCPGKSKMLFSSEIAFHAGLHRPWLRRFLPVISAAHAFH
jgi:hypothetical protein